MLEAHTFTDIPAACSLMLAGFLSNTSLQREQTHFHVACEAIAVDKLNTLQTISSSQTPRGAFSSTAHSLFLSGSKVDKGIAGLNHLLGVRISATLCWSRAFCCSSVRAVGSFFSSAGFLLSVVSSSSSRAAILVLRLPWQQGLGDFPYGLGHMHLLKGGRALGALAVATWCSLIASISLAL